MAVPFTETNGIAFSSQRRCRELLLRPGSPHEAAQDPHDAQPPAQLRPVQEYGDLCELIELLFVSSFVSLSADQTLPRSQRPHKANNDDMTKYHSDDYIRFLRSIRPDNMSEYSKQMQRCGWPDGRLKSPCCHLTDAEHLCFVPLLTVNVGEDCPVFDGLFEFCQLSTGGSVGTSSIPPTTFH